jgi:hypothetical protein
MHIVYNLQITSADTDALGLAFLPQHFLTVKMRNARKRFWWPKGRPSSDIMIWYRAIDNSDLFNASLHVELSMSTVGKTGLACAFLPRFPPARCLPPRLPPTASIWHTERKSVSWTWNSQVAEKIAFKWYANANFIYKYKCIRYPTLLSSNFQRALRENYDGLLEFYRYFDHSCYLFNNRIFLLTFNM